MVLKTQITRNQYQYNYIKLMSYECYVCACVDNKMQQVVSL